MGAARGRPLLRTRRGRILQRNAFLQRQAEFRRAVGHQRRSHGVAGVADNSKSLDKSGFAVFGRVVEGMEDVVERLYWGYGEMAPRGSGPDPTQIERKGNAYLDERFPRLDRIRKASVLP